MKSITKRITFLTVVLLVFSLLVATGAAVFTNYASTKSLSTKTMTDTASIAASKVEWELKAMMNVAIQAGCDSKLSSVVFMKSQKQAIGFITTRIWRFCNRFCFSGSLTFHWKISEKSCRIPIMRKTVLCESKKNSFCKSEAGSTA